MAAAVAAYGALQAWFAGYSERTDDAYVAGNVVQVTPQVAGTVIAIHADDTERVRAGAPLVELDRRDTEVVLDQAKAQLAQAVREGRTPYANNAALQATVRRRPACRTSCASCSAASALRSLPPCGTIAARCTTPRWRNIAARTTRHTGRRWRR